MYYIHSVHCHYTIQVRSCTLYLLIVVCIISYLAAEHTTLGLIFLLLGSLQVTLLVVDLYNPWPCCALIVPWGAVPHLAQRCIRPWLTLSNFRVSTVYQFIGWQLLCLSCCYCYNRSERTLKGQTFLQFLELHDTSRVIGLFL